MNFKALNINDLIKLMVYNKHFSLAKKNTINILENYEDYGKFASPIHFFQPFDNIKSF